MKFAPADSTAAAAAAVAGGDGDDDDVDAVYSHVESGLKQELHVRMLLGRSEEDTRHGNLYDSEDKAMKVELN